MYIIKILFLHSHLTTSITFLDCDPRRIKKYEVKDGVQFFGNVECIYYMVVISIKQEFREWAYGYLHFGGSAASLWLMMFEPGK